MPNQFLKKIVDYKKKLVKERESFYSQLKDKMSGIKTSRYQLFKNQISKSDRINLIAEIKKASPSLGMIREEFDLIQIARIYCKEKVDAISILTEDKYFLGRPEFIKKVSDECQVPVLAKDFFIDGGQIFEARFNGASAILLIVAILTQEELVNMINIAHCLDLDCLVEVHEEDELKKALDAGAEIIGVNNRNLKTFEVDLRVSTRLIPMVPKGKVIVAESGIKTQEDVIKLSNIGAHAVLIGEAFMRAENIGEKIRNIMGMREHNM